MTFNLNKNLALTALGAFLAFSSLSPCSAQAAELERIKQQGEINIGASYNTPVLGYQDSITREFSGFEIDLAREVAKRLGVQANFVPVSTSDRFEKLEAGIVDVLMSHVTITDERKQKFDFTDAYYQDVVSVLVKNDSQINELKDLLDKRLVVVNDSTSAQALVEELKARKLISADNYVSKTFDAYSWTEGVTFAHCADNKVALKYLDDDKVAGFVEDYSVLLNYKDKNRKFIKDNFCPQPYGIVGMKGEDLIPELNRIIGELVRDGTVERLKKQHQLTF